VRVVAAVAEVGVVAVVLRYFAHSPSYFACNRVSWPLLLAGAQMHSGDRVAALESYKRILASCEPSQRLDALLHAGSVLQLAYWMPLVRD